MNKMNITLLTPNLRTCGHTDFCILYHGLSCAHPHINARFDFHVVNGRPKVQ